MAFFEDLTKTVNNVASNPLAAATGFIGGLFKRDTLSDWKGWPPAQARAWVTDYPADEDKARTASNLYGYVSNKGFDTLVNQDGYDSYGTFRRKVTYKEIAAKIRAGGMSAEADAVERQDPNYSKSTFQLAGSTQSFFQNPVVQSNPIVGTVNGKVETPEPGNTRVPNTSTKSYMKIGAVIVAIVAVVIVAIRAMKPKRRYGYGRR
ncbi:hypothetical protein [Sediminibacterium ginsengisoli]|uniref:Uncharacterized protein n=1 Tax=Sediminibacterium ginsengisoli TaxID=413434 RepID=A0A1T4RXV0_9BACT|nr:hypothetical protein [Sediminibacterium ginsengisoli]SKA20820.1 hypothetical protein SAMN04488132_11635 [Sediminibacterium ginsengisoli]